MTRPILTPTQFENGIWRGFLQTEAEPGVEVRYLDQVLDDVRVSATDEGWEVAVAVPPAAVSEGVHCFVITDTTTSQKLGDFTIIAGAPAADDLRSEVALLRAELDMLKRAFRRSQASAD